MSKQKITEPEFINAAEPPIPPDVELRDHHYMALDVGRLIDSDLFALTTGDEFKAAVALWCKSWHQVPAGSIPANDRVLSHLSGAGTLNNWLKIKEMALHGWVLCNDGRYYHPVITGKAESVYQEKLKKEKDRERRAAHMRDVRKRPKDKKISAPAKDADEEGAPGSEEVVTVTSEMCDGHVTDTEDSSDPSVKACDTVKGKGKGRLKEKGNGKGNPKGKDIPPKPPQEGGDDDSLPPQSEKTIPVKEKTGRKARREALLDLCPDWLDMEDWKAFVEHRITHKSGMTVKAGELIIKKLAEFQEQGDSPKEVLEQTIERGWTGVFRLKDERGRTRGQQANAADAPSDEQISTARPAFVPKKLWADFIEHRASVGKKVTLESVEYLVTTLNRLHEEGHDIEAVIQQSIGNGWAGLFPLKDNGKNGHRPGSQQGIEDHNRNVVEEAKKNFGGGDGSATPPFHDVKPGSVIDGESEVMNS